MQNCIRGNRTKFGGSPFLPMDSNELLRAMSLLSILIDLISMKYSFDGSPSVDTGPVLTGLITSGVMISSFAMSFVQGGKKY